jgi:recombination protein RecT
MAPTSSTAALKQVTGIEKKPQSPQDVISGMIKAEMPRIQRLIQNPTMTQRFGQLAMMEIRRNPKLFECDPMSILACLMTSASLGLQLGVGGQAYLIPFKGECTFVPGWKGLMSLMHRTKAADVWTDVVRDGDYFKAYYGSRPGIEHEKKGSRADKVTHFYACGKVRGAEYPVIDVWSMEEILEHRSRFNKSGDKHYSYKSPEGMEAYGRKIPLLQVLKYMPVSFEMEQAADLDAAAEMGTQRIRPNDVIEGVMGAELPPAVTADPTPYDQAFDILEWDGAQRKAFLDEHKGKSEEDIKSLLNVEVDRIP